MAEQADNIDAPPRTTEAEVVNFLRLKATTLAPDLYMHAVNPGVVQDSRFLGGDLTAVSPNAGGRPRSVYSATYEARTQ